MRGATGRSAKEVGTLHSRKKKEKKPSASDKNLHRIGGGISVILSGMPSVGKTTAAQAIADRFNLKLLGGGDMLKEMAIERGYQPRGSDWWDGPEGMRFLSERKNNPDFDKEVDRRLIEKVKKGGTVITSYTVPWICDHGLKIWFAASDSSRARRLAGRDKISIQRARRILKDRDSKNMKIYKQLYSISFGKDLSVFNYIVDTEDLTANEVAAVACKLVQSYIDSNQAKKRAIRPAAK